MTNKFFTSSLIVLFLSWLSFSIPMFGKPAPASNFRSSSKTNEKEVTSTINDTSLVWSDEFNTSGSFDTSKWVFCERGHAAWTRFLVSNSRYAFLQNGYLKLRMDDAVLANDTMPYHSAGINTSRKFNLQYGKVEVRAKFNKGQGSWPAIWMMPDVPVAYGSWPNSGEIDIMEHVNNENVIHHTIHNAKVTSSSGGSTATKSVIYDSAQFNIYSIIWTPNQISFYVNNVLQYSYEKSSDADSQQWPFDKPFYIILNQSGGAGWPGKINNAHLPFYMDVDYVRVYKTGQSL